jgi:alkylation response protein AidB-like acyl-CoA dehydrogenase
MDFGLSEEQDMLHETVRGFAQNECPTTRLRELFDEGKGHDEALWNGLAEMGIAGLIVPEDQGGAGMELLDLALVAEVMGEYAVPGPFYGHALAIQGILLRGSAAQRESLLPALASGEQIATVALHETDQAWAPADWTAKLDGDRVSGEKVYVTHGAVADRLLVGVQGGELVWVDARGEGVTIEDQGGVDRTRPISKVVLSGAPAERLTGGEGQVDALLDAGAVLLAADAFGAASKLIDLDVAYSLEREQFGQPISQFQSIKHTIARLGTEMEPTRALFWYAAHALDEIPDAAPKAASLAKSHISDRAMETARQSVELHGGYGFTWECEVQMWFKRIMLNRSLLGTPDQHRDRIANLGGY